jgi:outer membrane protein OmpA-like peptidoglycan-associated protein
MKEMLTFQIRQARRRSVSLAILVALSTGGCSTVPDALNPVEWYKGTRDWISGEDEPQIANKSEAKPVPGADKPFPDLNTVPDRPPQSTAAERERTANSLIADRATARYSDEEIRRQDNAVVVGTLPPPDPSPPVPETTRPARQAAVPPVPPTPGRSAERRQPVSPPGAAPAANPVSPPPPPPPSMPNQPVSVFPDQPTQSTGLPRPPQPAQRSPLPTSPPPPPVIVGGDTPGPFGNVERPPMVNPSGGGPALGRPAQPAQPSTEFFEADRFAPRFPNVVGLPQRPAFDTPPPQAPAFDTPQSAGPDSPPVATIHFADGSARIGAGDRETIRQVYNRYRSRGGRIHVIGHASSRTRNLDQASHQLANFSISYERARAVAAVLERLGVPPEVIVVTAMSDQEPSFFEVMPAGEAGNRRAEIFFEN